MHSVYEISIGCHLNVDLLMDIGKHFWTLILTFFFSLFFFSQTSRACASRPHSAPPSSRTSRGSWRRSAAAPPVWPAMTAAAGKSSLTMWDCEHDNSKITTWTRWTILYIQNIILVHHYICRSLSMVVEDLLFLLSKFGSFV